MIGEESIEYPIIMQDGWIGEENGVRYWPVPLYPDIIDFWHFIQMNYLVMT